MWWPWPSKWVTRQMPVDGSWFIVGKEQNQRTPVKQGNVICSLIWLQCWSCSFPRIILRLWLRLWLLSWSRLALPLTKNEVHPRHSYCFGPCCFCTAGATHNQYPVSLWSLSRCPFFFLILISSNSIDVVYCQPTLITFTGGTGMYSNCYDKYAQPHFLTTGPFFVVCHDFLHLTISIRSVLLILPNLDVCRLLYRHFLSNLLTCF